MHSNITLTMTKLTNPIVLKKSNQNVICQKRIMLCNLTWNENAILLRILGNQWQFQKDLIARTSPGSTLKWVFKVSSTRLRRLVTWVGFFPIVVPPHMWESGLAAWGFPSQTPLLNPLAQVTTNHWKDIGCVHLT